MSYGNEDIAINNKQEVERKQKRKERIKKIVLYSIIFVILFPIILNISIQLYVRLNARIIAVNYVHKNYGYDYRVTSIKPHYVQSMPFANYLAFVEVIFSNKDKENDLFINVSDGEVVADSYKPGKITSFKYEFFYDEYIDKLFGENSSDIKYEASTHIEKDEEFTKIYQTYEEIVSDKEEIKSWNLSLVIRVYDKGDAKKYKWIYDYYKELRADEYQSVHIFLYFYNEDESLNGLYRGFTENSKITTDEIDRFFSK